MILPTTLQYQVYGYQCHADDVDQENVIYFISAKEPTPFG